MACSRGPATGTCSGLEPALAVEGSNPTHCALGTRYRYQHAASTEASIKRIRRGHLTWPKILMRGSVDGGCEVGGAKCVGHRTGHGDLHISTRKRRQPTSLTRFPSLVIPTLSSIMSAEAPELQHRSGSSTPATPPRARSPHPLAHLTPSKAAASAGVIAPEPSPRRPLSAASKEAASASSTPRSKGKILEYQAQDEEVTGSLSVAADAKSELRQQLLRERSWRSPGRSRASSSGAPLSLADSQDVSVLSTAEGKFSARRYYVLTNAGKPVFAL